MPRHRLSLLARLGLLSSTLLCAGAATAAGLVRYAVQDTGPQGGRAEVTIEWRDLDHARIAIDAAGLPAGTESYNLMRDGKLYTVTRHEGQVTVMELGAMLRLAGRMVPALKSPGDAADVRDVIALEPTGRRERVAGVDGTVYTLRYADDGGAQRTQDMVLGDDPTLREMTAVMRRYGQLMQQALGTPPAADGDEDPSPLRRAVARQHGGLLRLGAQMTVTVVEGGTPAAERFALPAEPVQLPDMAGVAGMGALAGAAATPATGGNMASDEARRQQERQQQRVKDRARSEVDNAADKAVDKLLGGFLDKLRGR
ncbi:hypothetical protein [Rubrivivax albus]|uniref:DUF4412 domain-containing protein n=1 Tax=Rubrivivax albus TaxID=2499835 RepID=A0A3S3SF08_9BURK|nr:hypothetical protein [Rubrivivax albus]RVT53993.1 hypothetical protein ENE75_03710 [Rubrivivax albus]